MATRDTDCANTEMDEEPPDDKSRFVLRQLNINNFVKFKDEQELKFENDGVYFLIGPNQTGKSSIFEAIRRCTSLDNQSSVSTSPNKQEDSTIVCTFKNKTKTIFSFYILKAIKDDQGHKDRANTRVDHDKTSPDDQNELERVILKGCIKLGSNGKITEKILMDRVKYSSGHFEKIELIVPTQGQEIPKSTLISNEYKNNFSIDAFHTWITEKEKLGKSTSDQNDKSKTKCEEMLKEILDSIVCVFPMRAIGPLQWSKSTKITKKDDNYAEASQRAEVIMWYLNEKGSITEVEQKNERLFYDYITGTEHVNYIFDDDQILQKNESTEGATRKNKTNIKVTTSEEEHPHPLLKMSEGFVEAKLCSILLAVSDFVTLLLEDPGYGMHPQMIDRLCTIMTEKVQNKVVIVSTHNSNFLKPWLMKNIFYFNKDSANGFNVISGQVFADHKELQSAIPNSITMEQFSNFCYADTIVFVEGVSDQSVLEAIACVLRKPDPKPNTRMQFGCLQFVSIRGHGNTMAFRKCCKVLNKKYAFVLDRDIWAGKRKTIEKAIRKEEEETRSKSMMNAETNKIETDKVVEKQTANEIEEHFFVWKFKDLEDVFFHGILEEYKDTAVQEIMNLAHKIVQNGEGRNLKISYEMHIQIEDKEEIVLSQITIKDITIYGILRELKDTQLKFTKEIDNILKNCFPGILITKKVAGSYIVSDFKKKPDKSFKLCIHGEESFEDRVKLIEFLLETTTIESAGEIKRLHRFLQTLDKIK